MAWAMAISHDCDILIIGAGPAGATAAKLLAERGLDVLLLEKKQFPRPKLCAGLLTWKTLRVLKEVFGTDRVCLKSNNVLHHESREYAICNRSGNLVTGTLEYPFHFVDRKTYDQFWLNAALSAGAKLRQGEGAVKVDISRSRVATDLGNTLRARAILGADGAQSRIRSELAKKGKIPAMGRKGCAMAIEGFVDRSQFPGLTHAPAIYFGFIPWGYAWSFPGPQRQIVGIAGLTEKTGPRLRGYFQNFLASRSLSMEELSTPKGFPLPYGNYLRQPGRRNILLAGDACGLADPLLGEGIYYAHQSGRMAAHALLKARPDYNTAADRYAAALEKTVIRELRWAKRWRNLIYTVLRLSDYRAMAWFIEKKQKAVEETIQGRRSFRFFRPR
jgi:geranylgeranyl reductase family protein